MRESDAVLVEQAARGDERAFHALVGRHAEGLYRLAYALVGNRADAEDVLQEAFAGAFRGLAKFEGRSAVRTWLGQILVRQAAALRRRRQTRRTFSITAGGEEPTVGGDTGQVDRREDVMRALAKLSVEHREVVLLREFEQMSYEEIAAAVGVPQGTVESRLHRARAELRVWLGSYGTDERRVS